MSNYTNQVGGGIGRKFGEIPSVFDWGCPSDGVTDCSVFINKAIISVSASGGGTLKIPGGYTYSLANPILFSKSTSGLVTTTGSTTVTKTSGDVFDISGRLDGSKITINSVVYFIDHVVDATHLVTTSAVPSGTGLVYSIAGTDNVRLVGDGSSSVIYRAANMLNASGNPRVGVIDITASNIRLEGFKIDGAIVTAAGVLYSTIAASTPTAYDPIQDLLAGNTSVWIHGGATNIWVNHLEVTHTGGYAILLDATIGNISDVFITHCNFNNNRPHLFGLTGGDLNYGSWTGGIHYQCDGTTYFVNNLCVTGCHFKRNSGNQVWGHGYAYTTMNTNITVTNNSFEDIGRDCIELGNTSNGLVEHNTGRRIGYIATADTGSAVPKWLTNQYAVFIDSTGVSNCVYNANSAISVYGAFCDLDGFAYGIVSNNMFRQPVSTDPEYVQDGVSAWADNYAYGFQTANSYFQPGGTNVSIVGNTMINCKQGGIRLFSAIGCHVADNTINHPASSTYPPIMIGNFIPLSGGAETHSYDTDVINNNIQWSPGTIAGAVQEIENWSVSPILWDVGEKNWVADNKIFGNCFEFVKAASSSSITGSLITNQTDSQTTAQHTLLSRTRVGSTNLTAFSDPAGNSTFMWDDDGKATITSQASDASHNIVAPAGNNRIVGFFSDADIRWAIGADSGAETGSNIGSDFAISRFTDAGVLIDTPFYIDRATGIVTAGTIASVSKFFDSFADTYSGSASASGTTITWTSGQTFSVDMIGLNFTYNGGLYSISGYTDNHHISVTPSAGTVGSTPFYIGNAFQTSTGTMQITSGGWGLFQDVVATYVFNSKADVYGGRAFQTSSGNCYIDGTGDAAFQSVAMNYLDIVGAASDKVAPSSGTARIEYHTTSGLRYNLGGAGWISFNTAPGTTGQIPFNNGSSAFTVATGFSFAPGTGTLTVPATGSNIGLQLANLKFLVDGNGNITSSGAVVAQSSVLQTASAPTQGSGYNYLYSDGTNLKLAFGTGTFRNIAYDTSTPTFGSVTAGVFNSTVTGTSVAFQTSSLYAWNGQGDIGVRTATIGNLGGAVTGAAGGALLSATTAGLFVSVNGGAPINISSGGSGVTSVNGATGAVTLVGGAGISITGTTVDNSGVLSFNGSTGVVTGVSSFNGSTGAITLSAAMVATAVGQALTTSSNVTFNIVTATTTFSGPYTTTSGSATISAAGAIAGQSLAVSGNVSAGVVSGIFVCQGSSGYTGTVASAAGRNILGGIII